MKLFTFNLHIAVISDITYILKDLYGDKVEIIDWNISDQFCPSATIPDCH